MAESARHSSVQPDATIIRDGVQRILSFAWAASYEGPCASHALDKETSRFVGRL